MEPPTSSPPPGAKPLWGAGAPAPVATPMSTLSPERGQKRHSLFGDAPLEPLSVKLLQAAGVLSLLLILVVVNSFLNGSGGESPLNPNPVAAAAQRTEELPGMRMKLWMQLTTESSPSPTTVTGEGTFNGEDNLTEFSYDVAAAGKQISFDAVMSEDAWYFRYPQFADQMPEGKEWVKLDGFPGQEDLSSPGVGNPDESLGMLRANGDVQKLGEVKIGQVQTSRYRVTMSPEGIVQSLRDQGKDELAEQLEGAQAQITGPVHAEVFITPSGMMRRMRTVTTVVTDGKTVTTEMRADLFDYGIHPDIRIPDDSQVLELDPEQMEAFGQAS
ncbi:MAG TPA: hypothetical protein VFJ53_08365 [Solirubrobacterales bacterium]|nr:hypothetical protein [Solirubrobacterales bacterium]